MSKKKLAEALKAHQAKVSAAKAERIVVAEYPYSHNPYIPHEPMDDCFPGCVNTKINPRFDYA